MKEKAFCSMTIEKGRIKDGLANGVHKGWASFIWMLKILIPTSLLTAVFQWSGVIEMLNPLVRPIMSLMGLPAMAALPLLSGILAGVYGGIASMAMLPFTREQMTLMAIFILISHNMIQEGVVQAKSGINPLKATIFRLAAGTITVLIVSLFLGGSHAAPSLSQGSLTASEPFLAMIQNWGITTLRLAVKIFFIIMVLLICLEVLKALGWIDHIVRFFSPVLWLLGLDRQVGILWITAVVFGLAYGAAVIVEEANRGDLSKRDLEVLHLSIGINHSMVEDPTLFLALGLAPFWLWIPRLIMAIVAVRLLKLWHAFRKAIPAVGV
jgi:spore maturation protein SpmB